MEEEKTQQEQPVAEAPKASTGGQDIQENKIWAAIAYLGILFLVPLLAKKDSAYAQYHAKQGLVLFVFGVIIGFVMIIPFLGWIIGVFGWILTVIFFIIGLVNALSGKMQPLPLIGKFGEGLKI